MTTARHDLVHITQAPLDAAKVAEDLRPALDEDERRRAALIRHEFGRARFEVAHGLTRHVLARELEVAPADIEFTRSPSGKPAIAGAGDLRFNISHSGGQLLIAIAFEREVGVDIEQLRAVDIVGMSRRYFAASEADAIARLSGDAQVGAFFRCWTRKESFIKAIGEGLVCPLHSFDVALDQRFATVKAAGTSWTITDLPAQPGFAAALTVEGDGWQLRHETEPAL